MTNDALKPLYIVIVDDVPYVFSNSRDAEKFSFNYKQPQKILMAHDKTRAALAPVDVESALDFLDKMIAAPYATYTSISRKQLKKLRQVIASQGLVGVPEWNDDIDAAPKKEGV